MTWYFGDGNTSTGSLNTSHNYSTPGTYTVTLTVIDDDGGSGIFSATIKVISGIDAIDDLIEYVKGLGLHQGTENSLVKKLENVKMQLEKDHPGPAANLLNAFCNEVKAQKGKKITGTEADKLVNYADRIAESL